jgi:hypothetical protein
MYIDFYHTLPLGKRMEIEQSPVDRDWMNNLPQSYGYRCLPMTYANRHGWAIKLIHDVQVIWDGSSNPSGTQIICGREQMFNSVFADNGTGNGVVTFHFNAVPRTPPDWNLWIIGAPNLIIPGASPLSGIVESDWMFSSPTMNWKITEPNKIITFKAGDPVIFFIPIHKTQLEEFTLIHKSLHDDKDMTRRYAEFTAWRNTEDMSGKSAFGKRYLKGKNPDGSVPEWPHKHKTKLNLHTPPVNE